MGFKCGIVGLPNVGKSTLFNALTATMDAESANFPFCTIDPNVGNVAVPDDRLYKLAAIAGSQKIIPTQIEFVDIAGLVKGASQGGGLGNKFLSHIREVDAIVYVLRCFEDVNITHVEGTVDPLRDAEIIEMELILADMQSLEKRIPNLEKKARGDKSLLAEINLMKRVLAILRNGEAARLTTLNDNEETKLFNNMQLLTSKPVMYICNVEETSAATGNQYTKVIEEFAQKHNSNVVVVSAQIEQEIANLESQEEKIEFLATIGLEETGLSRVIKSGYSILNLITYFTVGPKEARAWTVHRGSLAPQAAGVIHTDFERGFIKAEVISYDDYIAKSGEAGAKEYGLLRQEGKSYEVKDGDVIHFKFNV